MFSIASKEAKVEVLNPELDITEFKIITKNQVYSILLRKIYTGMWVIYYPSHADIPQYDVFIHHDMIAFHCCEKGMMQIHQNNQSLVIRNESICIHKVFQQNSAIKVKLQHYLGMTILIQMDNPLYYTFDILNEFPPHLFKFWNRSNTNLFLPLLMHSELVYILSSLLTNNPMATNISYIRIKVLEITLLIDRILETDSLFYDKRVNMNQEIIKEVKDFLVKNYNQDINIDQLSKNYGISKTSLKEIFKKTYGKPIMSYLREIRLNNSLVFLEDESLNISEISQMVGYTNQSKFANTFKKQFSISPHEYRNYLKKNKDIRMTYKFN